MSKGRKDDQGKRRWGLVPWDALGEIVDVLMWGAKKYGDNNWELVEDAEDRYSDALLRHVLSKLQGESVDADTGKSHLAHAGCCILFLLALELRYGGTQSSGAV